MASSFVWAKLISRGCILAILGASLFYVWAGSTSRADSTTTCIQCDQNNVNGLSNCSSNQSNCTSNCYSQYNACMNSAGPDIFLQDVCQQNFLVTCPNQCSNTYNTCTQNTWSSYDNCLYGFSDFSGICSIVTQPGHPPPSGRGRTPCDYACNDAMRECRDNEGDTCGQEFNDCKLSCG